MHAREVGALRARVGRADGLHAGEACRRPAPPHSGPRPGRRVQAMSRLIGRCAVSRHPSCAKHDLPAYAGKDSYNRGIDVQRSPDVGLAHMVPEDWDEPRGATGDIGLWSPG